MRWAIAQFRSQPSNRPLLPPRRREVDCAWVNLFLSVPDMVSQLAFQRLMGSRRVCHRNCKRLGTMPVGLAAATMSLFSLLFFASCGGMTQLAPTAPSPLPSGSISNVTQPPVAPSLDRAIHGTVGPFDDEAPSCFADLFPCER